MDKKKCIIVDLDGTLANVEHRLHFLKKPPGQQIDWDGFNNAMGADDVNKYCLEICLAFAARGYKCVFLTGRPESHRVVTDAWLSEIAGLRDYELFMRDSADCGRRNFETKKEIYLKYIEPEYDVLFAIDDDPDVIAMWRGVGVESLRVGDWF